MNEKLKDILIGLILGDGYLTPFYGQSIRSSLTVKANSNHLDYLQWLHAELAPLGVSELKPKKNYHQHQFRTRWHEEVGKLRTIFYPHGVKTIPTSIKELLVRPLALAVWYQDDGTLDCRSKYHYNALFATHCFSFDECVLLARALQDNFNLAISVCKSTMRGITRYRLYVRSKSMAKFMDLINPYILDSFEYKIRRNSQQQR